MTFPPRFLLRRAEQTFNALLKRDPATPQRLTPLIGHSLALRLTAPAWQVVVVATAAGLRFTDRFESADADARMTLSPTAVGALLSGAGIETVVLQGHIHVDGDIALVTQFGALLRQLDPDMEGALAQLIGQLPAHALMMQLRHRHARHHQAWVQLRTDGIDYATEEARILIGQRQMHVMRDQLDDLNRQLERSERRLVHLEYASSPLVFAPDNKEPPA